MCSVKGGEVIITYTHLEDYIGGLYKSISIKDPDQLEIDCIADRLRLRVHYGEASFRFDNNIIIKQSTQQKEWQSFGHEIAHFLRHEGNQLLMIPSFIDLQENQANHFAYHFCVPTFMLQQIKGVDVYKIMNLFNVEQDFALRRLEMYRNKIINRRIYNRGKRIHA